MEGERAPKRVRQACLNCRRKKTRCSGETPVCSFCARLKQKCVWVSDKDRTSGRRDSFFNSPDSALAARVALLEAKLNQLGAGGQSDSTSASLSGSSANTGREQQPGTAVGDLPVQTPPEAFLSLPSKPVLSLLIDKYFVHCHNQPYSYFHERAFRQRFEEDALPKSLLYALSATACRFTDEPPYQHQSSLAIATYSAAAWAHIFQQSFSYEDDVDVTVVQTLGMLAVIDFTAGHPRHGWVKMALAVRFAQALRLYEEPDGELPAWEREERRRTFWSMYLLDRLISLGPNRPPTFSDDDCSVHLPSSDQTFLRSNNDAHMPTLQAVIDDGKESQYQNLDYFASTVLMASTLGRFIRFCMKRTSADRHTPWDSRSAYCQIHSMLLQYESHSLLTYASLSEVLSGQSPSGSLNHYEHPGHLVFSQALFHLNNCLLNHPFILYNLFRRGTAPVPLTFAREALSRSHTHAAQLLELIDDAQKCGGLAESSFIGYCVFSAGIIFRLYEHHQDENTAAISKQRVSAALHYLERQPVRWAFHPVIASVIRNFLPTTDLARSLIDPIKLAQRTDIGNPGMLWSLIDYAALQSADRHAQSDATSDTTSPAQTNNFSEPATQDRSGIDASPSSTTIVNPSNEYWMPNNDMQLYLGDDMGGLWTSVFSSHRSTEGM